MIKKIELIANATASYCLYKLKFYTKIDGVWDIFNPGKCTSYTQYKAEFENMTVSSVRKNQYGNGLPNIFDLNYKPVTSDAYMNSGKVGDKITITFKQGIKVLSGIYYAGNANFAKNIRFKIYDENNILIYSDDSPSLISSTSNSNTQPKLSFYKTEGLELMRVYPVNTIGTIETNDNTQIKDVYQVDGITVTQNTPAGTDIKYIISFDGRKTYKTYKDGVWSNVDINNSSNIMEQGLSKSEIEAITSQQFNDVMTESKTVDIITGMVTNNEYVTPSVSQIKILYLKIV